MISSSLGLCLAARPVRGSVAITRAGLGWPTRSRALALTALAAENFPGLRFVMASMSMEEVRSEGKARRLLAAVMESGNPWKSAIFSMKRPSSAHTR